MIILFIAGFLQNFSDLAVVQHALAGIRVAVCVLVLNAVIKMFHTGVKDAIGICIFIICLGITYFSKVPTVLIIVVSALLGLGIQAIRTRNGAKKS